MFISYVSKYSKDKESGQIVVRRYYRLSKSYRVNGCNKSMAVLGLGYLDGLSRAERDELADMLTVMIEKGEYVFSDNKVLYELAMDFYCKYRTSKYALEHDPILKAEAERKEAELRSEYVSVKLSSLTQHEVRQIGAENICCSTLQLLKVRQFLNSKGWTREQTDMALLRITARAIYPYSELKTVRYLKENTALAEMYKIPKEKITKDALYQSALRLWDVHSELEDWLHQQVCNMFEIEEKILLFDITNTYFKGNYVSSSLCQYGRSKEKRSDCKIVVLAAVVNTEGLIVRTVIYEGNRHDSTTLEEVIGSLSRSIPSVSRHVVVMDAGFYSERNVRWLVDHGYDYITVLPAGSRKFTATKDEIVSHTDYKGQEIRLQMGSVEILGTETRALLVDSDMKEVKERSMWNQACDRYEKGLEAIRHGIETKGGTKKRDAVNKRLGKLELQYGSVHKNFDVQLTYSKKGKDEMVTAIDWKRNNETIEETRKFHGKYVLITSLDENEEVNVWKFYNVIRTVEETFHVLKTDLDIRPVYHKSDGGIKAHLNLAVLAYWVVSVTKYRLKLKNYPNVRWDEIMRIASTQAMVTARLDAEDGRQINIRQETVPEEKLAAIYSLLEINPHPLGKTKSVVHLKIPSKKNEPDD